MAGAGKVHAPIRQHDPVVGAKHKRIIGGFNRCAAHFFYRHSALVLAVDLADLEQKDSGSEKLLDAAGAGRGSFRQVGGKQVGCIELRLESIESMNGPDPGSG